MYRESPHNFILNATQKYILQPKVHHKALSFSNINVDFVGKISDGDNTILDLIKRKEIQLIINTPSGEKGKSDMELIRKLAVVHEIPCITTMNGAMAAVSGIEAILKEDYKVKAMQEYLR